MNNKKIQAQMQINVSFMGNTTNLLKQLQDATKSLKLDSSLYKPLTDGLTKGFKEAFDIVNQMSTGLSKKGLSPKQYDDFFNEMHAKLKDSVRFINDLKKNLTEAFNSPANKQGLKDLKELRAQLEAIQKLSTKKKAATTRKNTAIETFENELGLDYNLVSDKLTKIRNKTANKVKLRSDDIGWLANNGLTDTAKLQRAFELLGKIEAKLAKIKSYDTEGGALAGTKTIDSALAQTEKNIAKLEKNTISQENHKYNMAQAQSLLDIARAEEIASDAMGKDWSEKVLPEATKQAKAAAVATSTLREVFAQFGIHFSAAAVVKGFIDLLKSSFEFYKSLDSALNQIYVVSNLSINRVNDLQQSFINMAKTTGMALDDITRAAVLFYQQGLDTNAVLEMTRVTAQFAKVAGIDATDAANKLTAAVNGYKLSAEDAMSVADKFNKVAASSAADINELSTAFSKAAAQANQAGVSMDNYLAYIATMEEKTREAPENIGTSLKTIFSRMQQIKTGENTEDGVDVNAVETALRSVNIALRDTQGQLRDLEEIFAELGPRWNQLDRNTQAYLGTIIAGTRQQSRFITLMQNWDRVLDLAAQSENSAGQQALMHAKAMDSITSKIQQLNVAWQEFISNIGNSAVFKGVISSLTKILNLLNSGNKPIAAVMLAVTLLSRKLKDLNAPLQQKLGDLKSRLQGGDTLGRIGNLFENKDQKQNRLDNELAEQEEIVRLLREKYSLIEGTGDRITLNNGEVHNELTLKERIVEEEEKLKQKIYERNNLEKDGSRTLLNNLSKFGTAIQGLALLSGDTNTSGLLSGLGGLVGGVGRFGVDPIGGTVQIATGLFTAIKTLKDWDKNLQKKITDAVASVEDALTNAGNLNTTIKNTDKLIDRYKKLSNMLVRTTAQQEELNSIIQELSDSYDIDAITDAYGNLSINIDDVNEKLKEQKQELQNAKEELRAKEIWGAKDATGGLFNSNTISDFYTQLFQTNKSDYKTLLKGVEDGLTDATRSVSNNVAKAFASNLKNAITREVANNPELYMTTGFGNAMMNYENSYNTKLRDQDWNALYSELQYLQQSVNNMSFNDVQAHLDKFYESWSGHTQITTQEWKVLVDTMNRSVFDNPSLLDFYAKVDEMQGRLTGSYYGERFESIDKQLKEVQGALEDDANRFAEDVGLTTVAVALLPFSRIAAGIVALGALIKTTYDGIKTANDEDIQIAKQLEDVRDELLEQQEEYWEEAAKNNPYANDAEDAKRIATSYMTIRDALQSLNGETQKYLGSLKEIQNLDNMFSEESSDYAGIIGSVLSQMKYTEGMAEGDKYAIFKQLIEQEIDNLDDSKYANRLKEKLQKVIDEAYGNLSVTGNTTFTQLSQELDKMSKSLRSMNSITAEFKKNGAITLDTFSDLASILDNLDFSKIGAMPGGDQLIDKTVNALDNLNLAYDANTGLIKMNGKALQSLQDIQEVQTKSAILGKINELKANKATIETKIAMIDAEIEGADATLKALEGASDGQIAYTDVTTQANNAVQQSFSETFSKIQGAYSTDVQNMDTWKTAVIKDLADVVDAWNKYYTAVKNGTVNVDELYETASRKSSNLKWSGFDSTSGINWTSYQDKNGNLIKLDELRKEIGDYKKSLEHTRAEAAKSLSLTNAEIKLMTSLYNSDLSKLGGGDSSSSSKTKEIETYIGQLKEIYNILNRIDMLEHRLNTLDTYADVSKEKTYGDLLNKRLDYNQELLNQYDFLVNEQKKFTNGYKDFIGTVDGLEGVFDFDEFGQIIINWEKYINLQDTAVKGEVTLKQKADDVYETYQNMFDELKQDFDKYIAYLKNVINLLQEVIDSYKDMQTKAANSVKEIYEKILHDRLEAIDKEKKAIDELQEARNRARQDQENAKTLSGLQTNLQRAMMDTSGASDSNFIKAQKDIDDKLEAIADDKYSQMLEDIQQALDEEKDALQQDFDQLWENLDWLHEWLDNNIMLDETRWKELFQNTSEWQQASPLERNSLMEDWTTKYEIYMSQLRGQDGKTIYDVWDQIGQTRERIAELDKSLITNESKNSKEIIQTIKSWQSKTNEAIASATGTGSGGGSGGNSGNGKSGSGNSGNGNKKNDGKKSGGSKVQTCTISLNPGFDGGQVMKRTAVIGQKFTFPEPVYDRPGYEFDTWGGYKAGASFTPTGSSYGFTGTWKKKATSKSNQPKFLGLTLNPFYYNNGVFANGGIVPFSGPAWLDGTRNAPEAVLNPLQTEHFMKFTNVLDKMYQVGEAPNITGGSVSIDTISFNVESMSSPEDGEKAFNMFVTKFKEIGNQTGLAMNNFKNNI